MEEGMEEAHRVKRSKVSKGKGPMTGAREIQSESPELMVENDDRQEIASWELTPYMIPVSTEAGPSQPKSASQEETFREETPEQVVGITWDKLKKTVTQRFTPEYQEIQDTTQRDFILTHNDHESQVDNSRGGRDEASTSSDHPSKLSWENIERISDGLYKFYEPPEPLSANLDIFLFHALECEGAHVQDAHVSSWKSSSELGEIWPQKWLSQDFPLSRIISISYDCCTKQTDEGGRMDMYRITENLLQEIVWARKEHGCDRPVIFVGHGFGGIVMKQLCVYAHHRKENSDSGRDVRMFLDSIRGFLFYATPHLGVEGLKPPGKKDGPLLRWMYALNEELARLHDAFCKLKQLERYRWITFAVAGQDCNLGRPGLRLREGSSPYGDNYMTVDSSHFDVCRPSDKTSNKYQHLHTLIQNVLSRVKGGKEELGKIVAHRIEISTKSKLVLAQSCSLCIMRELLPKLAAIQFMDLHVDIDDHCEQCRSRQVPLDLPRTLILLNLSVRGHVRTVEAGRNSAGDVSGALSLSTCASLVKLELTGCESLGELSRLQQLRVLKIELNEGAGNWATSLGELRRLERLELVRIRTPFELPVSFGCLTALRYLKISGCRVRSVPVSFTNLTNLHFLEMDKIEGREAISVGSFPHLRVFKMSCWAIADLAKVSRGWTALESLELVLEEAVPDVFGHLENLRNFQLTCNGLENNLVESWGKLTSLEKLYLRSKDRTSDLEVHSNPYGLDIRVEGQVAPSGIFEPAPVFLTRVERFTLECEHVSTTALARNMIKLKHLTVTVHGQEYVQDIFERLQNLRTFKLVCNGIENSLAESLGALSSLERLELRCKTMERFPHVFGCFSTLKHLWISCPSLRALPITVGNFIELRTFKIFATGLQSLPDSIGQLSQLQKLSIVGCNHLTTLPESLGQLSRLVSLKVRHCQNLKSLPETVGHLSSLRCLDLQGSALHFLPDALKNLSQFRRVNISGCSNLDLSLATENFPQLDYEWDSGSEKSYHPDSSSDSGSDPELSTDSGSSSESDEE